MCELFFYVLSVQRNRIDRSKENHEAKMVLKYFINKNSKNTGGFRRYVAKTILFSLTAGVTTSLMYWEFVHKPRMALSMALDKELYEKHQKKYGSKGLTISDEEREKLV